MKKDAFYFPHYSNARNDRKLRRLRRELGVEGYGAYFMTLETLREQDGFKYPLEDIDLLADEFGLSEQKLRTVICNYDLFQVDNEENFFSTRFIEYMQPYLETLSRNKISGIKGNLVKYGKATKEQLKKMSDVEIVELNNQLKESERAAVAVLSRGDSGGDRNKGEERRGEEIKEIKDINNTPTSKSLEVIPQTAKEEKRKKVPPKKEKPTREEFVNYGLDKLPGVCPQALGLKYDSWDLNDWKDGYNKPVKNWKAKLNNTLAYLPKAKKEHIEQRIETMQQVRSMWNYDENGNLIDE